MSNTRRAATRNPRREAALKAWRTRHRNEEVLRRKRRNAALKAWETRRLFARLGI